MDRMEKTVITFIYANDKENIREAIFENHDDALLFWSVLEPLYEQGKISIARFFLPIERKIYKRLG